MSATPIPRTYALTIYGDMEISSIKTKPVGRKDVITYFKKEKDIISVLEMMKKEIDLKHQIYVIAPMIETADTTAENVTSLEEKMNKAFGKIAKIASIHGKLEPKEKNKKVEKKKRTEPVVEIPIVTEEKAFEEAVDDDATVMMDGRYLLVLKDVKDNSKIFKYPMDEKIIIGRNVDKANIVIDYNRAVSGQHCEIYTMANRFFIKDLNSANHTYVNQKVCIGETEIFQGCTIKLGDLELEVEIVAI